MIVIAREQIVDESFARSGTDKRSQGHNYAQVYASIPENIENVLEIGVSGGESLKAWLEIFPSAQIYGVDICPLQNEELLQNPRIHFIESDINKLETAALPDFDLIVDDGSHAYKDVIVGWQRLEHRLRGTYVIEDVQPENVLFILTEVPDTASVIVTKQGGDHRVITWKA